MDDDHYPDDHGDWDDDWPGDDDDSAEVVPCSHCGAEVYEDAVQCPVCREYITASTHPMSGKPLWYVLLALAGIGAVIAALSGWAGLF